MARGDESGSGSGGLGGLLGGLTEFVDKLNQLAEKGQQISKTGNFDLGQGGGEQQKPLRGVYGFSVKMGTGGESPKVEPFGNIRRDEGGEPVVEDAREPLVDVFDEGDHVLVLAEMPGVESRDVRIDVDGTQMELSASRGERKYHKRFELPSPADKSTVKLSEKNGIVEIRCAKPGKPG
jgi:HSP20 family protein